MFILAIDGNIVNYRNRVVIEIYFKENVLYLNRKIKRFKNVCIVNADAHLASIYTLSASFRLIPPYLAAASNTIRNFPGLFGFLTPK